MTRVRKHVFCKNKVDVLGMWFIVALAVLKVIDSIKMSMTVYKSICKHGGLNFI